MRDLSEVKRAEVHQLNAKRPHRDLERVHSRIRAVGPCRFAIDALKPACTLPQDRRNGGRVVPRVRAIQRASSGSAPCGHFC